MATPLPSPRSAATYPVTRHDGVCSAHLPSPIASVPMNPNLPNRSPRCLRPYPFPSPAGRLHRCLLMFAAILALASGPARAEERKVVSLLEMRHQNVVLQKWDLSCGAAALTTLLNYQHGEELTEKEVAVTLMNRPEYIDRPELIQIREGFSLLDLKRYAELRGYKGIGLGKMEMKDLESKAPLLVPINVRGYNHFVVFRGMRGNRVLLADPAWGNRTMLKDEFEQAWIDYPTIGRVGFAVERNAPPHPTSHKLTASADDFVMLR